MRLPILPDTIRIEVQPGVTAVVRPFTPEALARWHDKFPNAFQFNAKEDAQANVAAWVCVRERLVGIEGVEVEDESGEASSFDVQNERHMASIPTAWTAAMYAGVIKRAMLTGDQEKNSGSPSASDGTSTTQPSPVAGASNG